jgi:DNA-binding response OmpR family regulator
MANAVLVAEPEPATRGFLERHLADDGFDVLGAAECGAALELAERARPDLVLLGDTAALEECRSWSSEVPLIVIGAPEADAVDRARALERGADDFLSRPFLYDELLLARIRAVLRRTAPVVPDLVHVGVLEIDRLTRRVAVGGKRIDLPAKEYELLLKLASEPSRVFTKEELLRDVWGFRSIGKTRTLDSHASRLRRKLARAGGGPFVVNVWGVGYRLLED